jgi:hypothetical protein
MMNKDKKRFMREALQAGGTAVDMCATCRYQKLKDEFLCEGCPESFRQIPGWPEEEYLHQPIHGRGSA